MPKAESGLTFDGYIHEFEGIRVDNFTSSKRTKVEFFLLTHAHSDHLKGLDSSGFSGHTIYCSEITKSLIKLNQKFNKNITSMKVLQLNKRHEISYHNGFVFLTLIPSRHCAGSVMFLIESKTKSILLTGDIKAESDWVESLPRNKFLSPYITGKKQLDNIYLDTTYGYRGEPYIEMKPFHYSVQSLVDLIELYPKNNDIEFHFVDQITGFEDVWIHISTIFNEKFHVSNVVKERLKMLDGKMDYEYNDSFNEILSSDPNSKFHCCATKYPFNCSKSKKKFKVIIKHCIDINIKDLHCNTLPLSYDLKKNDAILQQTLPNGDEIYTIHDIEYLLPRNGTHFLRNKILFFHSRHSSYTECRHFISLFNVKQVYPTTESAIEWERGFQMKRHFGDLCTSKQFLYDDISASIYGSPPIMKTTPTTIDKLSESLYLRSWLDDIKSTTTSLEFDFKGQQFIKNLAYRQEKDDLDSQERKVVKDEYKLCKSNHLLSGRHQYVIENQIREHGYSALRKYKVSDDIETQNSFDSDCFQENDSMERAVHQMNQLIKRKPVLADCGSIGSKTLASPFKPLLPPQENTTINIDCLIKRIGSNGKSSPTRHAFQFQDHNISPIKNNGINILKKRLLASPMKAGTETHLNLSNVERISNVVLNDENYGFFQFDLKSCKNKRYKKKTPRINRD